MSNRVPLTTGILTIGLVFTGCSSGSSSPGATPTTAPTNLASTTSFPPGGTPTTAALATGNTETGATGTAICPTLAQADTALGSSYSGPIRTATTGGGIVCEYTSGAGVAGVTIFAHQSATIFAGQVAHAPGALAMPAISGVGDGAFGYATDNRSIVNAYSNASRTFVAAQAPGALAPVEALARLALADD